MASSTILTRRTNRWALVPARIIRSSRSRWLPVNSVRSPVLGQVNLLGERHWGHKALDGDIAAADNKAGFTESRR